MMTEPPQQQPQDSLSGWAWLAAIAPLLAGGIAAVDIPEFLRNHPQVTRLLGMQGAGILDEPTTDQALTEFITKQEMSRQRAAERGGTGAVNFGRISGRGEQEHFRETSPEISNEAELDNARRVQPPPLQEDVATTRRLYRPGDFDPYGNMLDEEGARRFNATAVPTSDMRQEALRRRYGGPTSAARSEHWLDRGHNNAFEYMGELMERGHPIPEAIDEVLRVYPGTNPSDLADTEQRIRARDAARTDAQDLMTHFAEGYDETGYGIEGPPRRTRPRRPTPSTQTPEARDMLAAITQHMKPWESPQDFRVRAAQMVGVPEGPPDLMEAMAHLWQRPGAAGLFNRLATTSKRDSDRQRRTRPGPPDVYDQVGPPDAEGMRVGAREPYRMPGQVDPGKDYQSLFLEPSKFHPEGESAGVGYERVNQSGPRSSRLYAPLAREEVTSLAPGDPVTVKTSGGAKDVSTSGWPQKTNYLEFDRGQTSDTRGGYRVPYKRGWHDTGEITPWKVESGSVLRELPDQLAAWAQLPDEHPAWGDLGRDLRGMHNRGATQNFLNRSMGGWDAPEAIQTLAQSLTDSGYGRTAGRRQMASAMEGAAQAALPDLPTLVKSILSRVR